MRPSHSGDVRTERQNVAQPGSRIVVPYLGETDRVFDRILEWHVGDGTCWVSICGESRLLLKVGARCCLVDVTGPC